MPDWNSPEQVALSLGMSPCFRCVIPNLTLLIIPTDVLVKLTHGFVGVYLYVYALFASRMWPDRQKDGSSLSRLISTGRLLQGSVDSNGLWYVSSLKFPMIRLILTDLDILFSCPIYSPCCFHFCVSNPFCLHESYFLTFRIQPGCVRCEDVSRMVLLSCKETHHAALSHINCRAVLAVFQVNIVCLANYSS